MDKQFFINYVGNKYKESIEINDINYDNYTTIIEPFCGSYGFSRYIYVFKDINKDKKYILYDKDEELINFYKHLQELKRNNKLNDFMEEYNNINLYLIENYKLSNKSNRRIKGKPSKEYINNNIKNEYLKFMLYKNLFMVGFSDVNLKGRHIDEEFINMLDNITFINSDFKDINFNSYNQKKTLIYIDPPYLFDDNTSYKKNNFLNNEFYRKLLDTFYKYKIILVHSYNVLLNHIFKEYRYIIYNKKYGKKKDDNKIYVYYKKFLN